MTKIPIVDTDDNILRYGDKLESHLHDNILHRAFSVFVFNTKGQLLIQQRSKSKLLWPLCWSNSCCSHPLKLETYEEAGERRLKEEMGFTCPLTVIGRFQYRAVYKDIGFENELCSVLIGTYDGEIYPDNTEVADYKWMCMIDLKKGIKENPRKYTPWFKKEITKFKQLF